MSDHKNIIITGANSGIGLVATKKLCAQGHHVFVACRSKERAEAAIAEVKKTQPDAKVTFMELDLSDLESVRAFAKAFREQNVQLDVLVNNAGVFYPMRGTERHTTTEGFEMTMATNHLGHFLLTHLLLDELKAAAASSGEARVVNVVSLLHDTEAAANTGRIPMQPLDCDDFMLEKDGAYNGLQAYKNSKVAGVMVTKVMAKQLEGSGVTVNCMCPGFIPRTGLTRHTGTMTRFMLTYFLDGVMKLFKKITRSPEEGGQSIVFLATGAEVKGLTGGYYSYDKLTESSAESRDEAAQEKVLEMSRRLCHLETSS